MVLTSFLELARVPGNQHVSTGALDTDPLNVGWSPVAIMEGSRLTPNQTYAFVYMLNMGSFRFFFPDSPRTNTRVEIGLQTGSSTFGAPLQRLDPFWPNFAETFSIPFQEITDGLRGLSFMYIEFVNVGAVPETRYLNARIVRQNGANSPGGLFTVNEAQILALDLDAIDAFAGLITARASDVVEGPIASFLSTPDTRASLTLPEDLQDWLIFQYAQVTPTNSTQSTRFWAEDGTGSQGNLEFHHAVGVVPYGVIDDDVRICTGQMTYARSVDALQSLLIRQRTHSTYDSPPVPAATFYHGKILAVKMGGSFAPFLVTEEPAPDFWAPKFQGNAVTGSVLTSDPEVMLYGYSASADVAFASHFPEFEINGGLSNPAEFYLGPDGSFLAVTPINGFFQVTQEGTSTLQVRLAGTRNPFDLNFPGTTPDGHDVRLFGLTSNNGALIPLPPGDIAGAIVAVLPNRETTIPLGSLTELPTEPSYQVPIDVEGVVRGMAVRRGDKIVHTKFLTGRRIYKLGWRNLPEATGIALLKFLDDVLVLQGGTFAWKAAGDAAKVPWTLETGKYKATRLANGVWSRIETAIVELVFFVA